MKVTILSESLQKQLSVVNKAISSKTQLQILSHVLLEAKHDLLVISGTDLEIGIEVSSPAQVEEEGATTVPAKLFLELINSLAQDKITLETTDGALVVKSKKTKTILQTTPKDEFPLLFEEKGEKTLEFAKGTMKHLFGRIIFATSTETTRPALSGVLLQEENGKTTIVATDGYRMSLDEIETKDKEILSKLIIPSRILREATNLSEEADVKLYISQKTNQILFEGEHTIIVGRMIEAEFPNYKKVIPTDEATVVSIDREELLRAVKTCAIFAREAANIITLSLTKDGTIVAAKTPSLGENTVVVESVLKGEENEIAFNARYLLEALSNVTDNELSFSMTGPLNPGVFRVVGNTHFLHLIMPIRT